MGGAILMGSAGIFSGPSGVLWTAKILTGFLLMFMLLLRGRLKRSEFRVNVGWLVIWRRFALIFINFIRTG